MPGPPPKPIAAQIAAGDPRKRGKGVLNALLAAEPQATKGLPPCPKHLSGLARKAWAFLVRELEAMDCDRRPDAYMLEGACVAYENAISAYDTVKAQGRFIARKALDPKTQTMVIVDVKPHPAVKQGNQAWALLKSFTAEFGLTPVSRMRLALEKPDTSGEVDLIEILGRPREPRKPRPEEVIN